MDLNMFAEIAAVLPRRKLKPKHRYGDCRKCGRAVPPPTKGVAESLCKRCKKEDFGG